MSVRVSVEVASLVGLASVLRKRCPLTMVAKLREIERKVSGVLSKGCGSQLKSMRQYSEREIT